VLLQATLRGGPVLVSCDTGLDRRLVCLQACKMLSTLDLTAPALRHLSAPQCQSLASIELRGSDTSAAARLRTLNLMGAVQLPSAVLHAILACATQLQSLNVSACRNLGALAIPGALDITFAATTLPLGRSLA
jgi:hypothetical protein